MGKQLVLFWLHGYLAHKETTRAQANFERSSFHANRAGGTDGEGGCFMLLNHGSPPTSENTFSLLKTYFAFC